MKTTREVQRCLTTELDDHTLNESLRLLEWTTIQPLADVQHILMRQRLEEQQIRSVIIRRNRLRIRVDHDRFDPQVLHRECRLHAAVVELDALPDAVRPAADD